MTAPTITDAVGPFGQSGTTVLATLVYAKVQGAAVSALHVRGIVALAGNGVSANFDVRVNGILASRTQGALTVPSGQYGYYVGEDIVGSGYPAGSYTITLEGVSAGQPNLAAGSLYAAEVKA